MKQNRETVVWPVTLVGPAQAFLFGIMLASLLCRGSWWTFYPAALTSFVISAVGIVQCKRRCKELERELRALEEINRRRRAEIDMGGREWIH